MADSKVSATILVDRTASQPDKLTYVSNALLGFAKFYDC